MLSNGYQYALDVYKNDGQPLKRMAVRVDWEPALEAAWLLAVRRGQRRPDAATGREAATIEPVWDPVLREPSLTGFRVRLADGGGPATSSDFSLEYFRGLARHVSACFVQEGLLKQGELFRYGVVALERGAPEQGDGAPSRPFAVEELAPPVPVRRRPLAELLAHATPRGLADPASLPVLIPQHVLDETIELANLAGTLETGGVLIGHLEQDVATPEIAVVVTAQIPVEHSRSELCRLTFTAETWTAARQAIAQRGRKELMVGWWHSHSFLKETCKDCDRGESKTCNATGAFMSDEDCALHRTVFPRAHSIALVVSASPCAGVLATLFGWRRGLIVDRGHYVLGPQWTAESSHERAVGAHTETPS